MSKPYRVLAIHDIETVAPDGRILRWAYAHRTHILQKLAPDDFIVDRISVNDLNNRGQGLMSEYDLVFNLDYSQTEQYRKVLDRCKAKTVFVTSFNKDSRSRHKHWDKTKFWSHWVLVNNVDRFTRGGIDNQTCCISNGVMLEDWDIDTPIHKRLDRVVWTGGENPRRNKNKGYADTMLPAKPILKDLGFICDFRFVKNINHNYVVTHKEMRSWYNRASYVVCMSTTEGTPNFILEGMACGCVPVSSMCGNVPELEAIVKVPRSVASLVAGLVKARERKNLFSQMARDEIHNKWGYRYPDGRTGRIDYFFALFRALLTHGPRKLKPFNYQYVTPAQIEANEI